MFFFLIIYVWLPMAPGGIILWALSEKRDGRFLLWLFHFVVNLIIGFVVFFATVSRYGSHSGGEVMHNMMAVNACVSVALALWLWWACYKN